MESKSTSVIVDRSFSLSFTPHFFALFFATILASTNTTSAQFLQAELRSLSRTGAQIGTSIELSVLGERLDEADRLHFSHPGLTATVKPGDPKPEYGKFTVQVDKDVPPGRYDVRVIGRHGVSNPRAFLVSALANAESAEISHDANAPTPLASSTLTHGIASGPTLDFFSVHVDAGKSLRVELIAQRLDSRMIGQLRLFDSSHRLVASARGADEFDPVLTIDDQPAGDYVLAAQDFMYRAGDDYRYQIVVQDAESAVDLFPVASGLPESVSVAREARLSGGDKAASTPQQIALPYEATWSFTAGHGSNVFEFEANQGDAYSIEVISQRLGEPTDARLSLKRIETDAAGVTKLHDLLIIDDSQNVTDGLVKLATKDPIAEFVAPASAFYRLEIRDLDVGESLQSQQRYRLRIEKLKPSFDLAAYHLFPHSDINQSRPHGSKLFRGGAETIRVLAVRRDGWTGPIELSVENLPVGVSCETVTIAANQTQTQLTLTVADDAAGSIASIGILGRSIDGQLESRAVPITIAATKGGNREFIRTRIADELVIAVSEKDLSPISIRLGESAPERGTVFDVKKGETLTLPVTITRREGGSESLTVRPRDLPPGVTAAEFTVEADKSDGNLVISATGAAAPGAYSLWVQAETKIKLTPDAAPVAVFIPSSTANFRIIEP